MLELKNISFGYSEKNFIKNLSLKIEKGQHLSVIGASGCGKSTLLQIIYGLHHVEGKVLWNNKELLGPNFNLVPGEDFIKYLTQNFDLMPSISVADNIGKYLSNMYPRKKKQRINELLNLVEMKEFSKTKAKYLSGGQQQRVALARVLAKEPEILLLDEPFSHIDHFRKNKLRRNLFSYLKEKGITCLVATHDSTDALSFADETLVMDNGKIIARGAPKDLYEKPKNAYVASLFGEINELPLYLFSPKSRSTKKLVIYPHEIVPTRNSNLKAEVRNSFFKGNGYLVEGILQTSALEKESANCNAKSNSNDSTNYTATALISKKNLHKKPEAEPVVGKNTLESPSLKEEQSERNSKKEKKPQIPEGFSEGIQIFFESSTRLEKGTVVGLEVSREVLESRISI